ncbi:MAG: hemolysin family protein [Phycisphaerae bacterium]
MIAGTQNAGGVHAAWGEFVSAHLPELIVLPALLVLSACFSGSETALFNLTRAQLHRFLHGGRAGQLVVMLMRRPRRLLNVLLLGNMIVNTAYAGMSAYLVLELNSKVGLPGVLAAAVSFAPLLVLILLGEVAPKSMAMVLGERMALLAAPAVEGIGRLLAPLLWVLDRVFVTPLTRMISPRPSAAPNITADELAALLDLSARRGVINLQAGAMLQEIVSLTDLRARDIMVPRVDMVAVEASWPADRVVEVLKKSRLRRVPVYEGDVDHVLGVVHAKRVLLNPGRPLRELVAKAPFIPEAANVERVLTQFRVTRTQTALVVDEYGGTAGLVTLEDVLEEIVGDLPDPHRSDRRLVERISRSEYLVDGELGVHEWADVFQTNLGGRRISTVGGFVTSLLGRIPREGDVVVYRNLRFTVQSMRRRRIEKLRLELLEGAP